MTVLPDLMTCASMQPSDWGWNDLLFAVSCWGGLIHPGSTLPFTLAAWSCLRSNAAGILSLSLSAVPILYAGTIWLAGLFCFVSSRRH